MGCSREKRERREKKNQYSLLKVILRTVPNLDLYPTSLNRLLQECNDLECHPPCWLFPSACSDRILPSPSLYEKRKLVLAVLVLV